MSVVRVDFQNHAEVAGVFGDPRAEFPHSKLLQECEARFRVLTALSTDWYWEQDEAYRFTMLAGGGLKLAGIDPAQVLGTTRWDCGAVPAGDDGAWIKHKAVLEARRPFADFVVKRLDSNGVVHYVSSSGQPIIDENAGFAGYRGTAKDVTQRLQMELRLVIEHAVTRILGESTGIADAAPKILRVVCETLQWACGTRRTRGAQGQELRCAETWGAPLPGIAAFLDDTRQRTPSFQVGGLSRRAWLDGKPVWVRDVTQESTFGRAPEALKAGLRSAFAFPIKIDGEVVSVMEFFSREIHQPDPVLLDCMVYVGSQIGQFMQRARAEEAQRRFRAAIDVSADLVLLIDPVRMVYVDVNETACRKLGYSREELLAMGPHDLFSMSRDELAVLYRRLIAGDLDATAGEGTYRCKDGSQFVAESFRRAVAIADGHVIVAVARDITERKRGEQLLHLEHTVTRCLSEADSVSGALKSVIRTICKELGWAYGRYFHADEQAGVLRFTEASGISEDLVARVIEKSRSLTYTPGIGLIGRVWQSREPLWLADIATDDRAHGRIARELGMRGAFAFPIVSESKAIGVLALTSEGIGEAEERLMQTMAAISNQIGQYVQRKQAEDVLRESEERFRAVVDSANDGILVYDRALQVVGGNAAAARIIGLPLADLVGAAGFTSLLPCVREDGSPLQPEDRPTRITVRTGRPLTGQIIGIKRPDGAVTWLSMNTGFLRRPGESDHYGVVSTLGDITNQRRSEAALRESEGRFRSLTNLSSDWFWEQDAEFRYTRLEGRHVTRDNPGFISAVGRTLEESGVEIEGEWEAHRALLAAHQPFRNVIMRRTYKDGQPRYLSASGEPMFDSGHRFVGYRGVAADITEHMRAEALRGLEHLVTRCLSEADSVGAALKSTMRAICESEDWECGRYLHLDERAGFLRVTETWGIETEAIQRFLESSRKVTYAPGVGLAGRVWQSGEPLWLADIWTDSRAAQITLMKQLGLHGAVFFPLMAKGNMIGMLLFNSREVREPEDRLLQAMRVIGSQIGQFVQRKGSEQATLRLGRMFAALSETNEAILHCGSPEALYQQVCDAAVHGGKFSNTSIFLDDDAGRARVVAGAGRVARQLQDLSISFDDTHPQGQGLVGIAFRSQRPIVSNDFLADERTRHRHELARQTGFRSAAALPLIQGGRSIGVVLIFDDELNAFDDEIVNLLKRMAENVSFALDNFGRETERRQAEERIQYLATHDGLTDLPNRVMFSQVLGLAIESARRYDRGFAVLFLDLDRFKIINDTLGHEAGDTLLKEMSQRIKENLRGSDIVARLGGDEFVVLLQEVSDPEQVAIVARKLLSILLKPVIILGQECRVTASIGISMYPTHAQDEQSLMKNADIAMYFAKEEGKNNFQFYSKEIKTQSLERLTLETSLRHGLECEEFFLDYQAKLDLSSKTITGVEALLRWRHPELGVVSPLQFIPLAEETGLIVPIGRWVFRTACAQNVAWQRAGLPPVCMAVNLSPRQFADENLLRDLAAVLQETGMTPELLELEITESMVMGNVERAAKQLAAIKAMGIRLAIDDFGTGYSSLAQIKRFPIDTLKIDRSFIRDIPRDAEDMAITEAIIAMGKTLSLTVIAEGVETVEQEAFLRDRKCDQTQGYYFSRPVTADKFAELLLRTSSNPGPVSVAA